MSRIDDGAGRGRQAAVDAFNRLETRATTETDLQESSSFRGKAFTFSSNLIPTAATGTEIAVLLIRHTGEEEFRINNISIHSTTGPAQWRLYKNPTNINLGTASTALNMNFGSPKAFDGETILGTDAAVMTGISAGSRVGEMITFNGHAQFVQQGAFSLGQNESIGITVQLSSSAVIGCTMIGHDVEEL